MSALKAVLTSQFGPGKYITNSDLDWAGGADLYPLAQDGIEQVPDALIDPERLAYGAGGLSVGFNTRALGFTCKGVSVFGALIKVPGSDAHRVPRQLAPIAPVLQQIISHEYAANPDTHDKFCQILFRYLPLKPGVKQVSENSWHIHKIMDRDNIARNAERMRIMEVNVPENFAQLVSRHVVQSEYLFSDVAGSLIQTAPSDTPMALTEKDGEYVLTNGAPAHHRQALPGEIVKLNSHVFHCAATPNAIEYGRPRSVLFVGFTGTKAMESRLHRARQRSLVVA